LRVSKRASRVRLSVHNDGRFVVTIPSLARLPHAEAFMRTKSAWILRKLAQQNEPGIIPKNNRRDYNRLKETARELVANRLEHFNQFYNFKVGRVAIRMQTTRWGSCSRKGNLNFSYRVALLPPELVDYIIAHELCHLKEFNHSKNFWALVGQTVPNWQAMKKELRRIS